MVPYFARNRTVIDSFELNMLKVEDYKLNEEVSRLEQMVEELKGAGSGKTLITQKDVPENPVDIE
ncbi:hypothetical protein YC2023_118564 [Brassica napus]